MTSLNAVHEFHTIFNHPINDTPKIDEDKLNWLRINLIQEELDELKEALNNRDVKETLDALCDLQYVLDGAFLSLGFWKLKDAGVGIVHKSNLSKLDANGKPIKRDDGKILKSEFFQEPDFSTLLNL